MQEHPDWRWERNRRERIRARMAISALIPAARSSLSTRPCRSRSTAWPSPGLPTAQFAPGRVNIECRDMKHFVEQMVLIAKDLDIDYEAMRRQIELTRTR
jgi:hypothetical protein